MSGQLGCDVTGQQLWGWSADPCNTDRRQQIQQKIREDKFNSTDNSGKSEKYVQIHTLLLATYLTIVTKNINKICNTGSLKRNTSFIVGTFFVPFFLTCWSENCGRQGHNFIQHMLLKVFKSVSMKEMKWNT